MLGSFLLSDTQFFKLILYYFHRSGNCHFSKEHWFLFLRMVLKNPQLALEVSIAVRVGDVITSRSLQLTGLNIRCVCKEDTKYYELPIILGGLISPSFTLQILTFTAL